MDYEKLHKNTLIALQQRVSEGKITEEIAKSICADFVKESEDERIRKDIIKVFTGEVGFTTKEEAKKYVAWLEKQGEPTDKGEISDGYHTFNELYYYRMLYNAAFFNMLPKEWVHKSKKHHDGEECFGGGWFIVMANLPTGQVSNHYELKDWDLFQIPEKETSDKWDGHTPQEAADRLHKYLLEKQGELKFPSLSEKEIVCLKRILDFLRKEHNSYTGEDFTNEIAVLEWLITHPVLIHSSELQQNQGEQKSIDQKLINEYNEHEPTAYETKKWNEAYEKGYKIGYMNGKNEQKPAWSEEDERMLTFIIEYLERLDRPTGNSCIHWLKSLRPQSHWKPTKEQIDAIGLFNHPILKSLYEDLKKL